MSTPAALPARRRGRRRHRRADAGTVTAFTVILTLAVFTFAGLVLDAGLAISTKVQAVSDAQSAARAGARELDVAALRTTGVIRLDPAQSEATARNWLTRAGLSGTVAVTPDTVTVTVHTSRRTQLLQLVGLSTIPIAATATARAVQP
jgi:hypothetical protein